MLTTLVISCCLVFIFLQLTNPYISLAKNAIKHNIIPSTISVTTSFLAVYLTFRRSPYFALAYAANDIVLIILWILASLYDIRYVSVVVHLQRPNDVQSNALRIYYPVAVLMPLYALPARQRSCEPAPGLFPRPHGRIAHNAYRFFRPSCPTAPLWLAFPP